MWPFGRKRRTPLSIPHLDIKNSDAELNRLRLAALEALEHADKAAEAALAAIDKGAPADCPEVLVTRDAVHEANVAVEAWIRAGGL